jgi:uncharacterized phiE125 gp8 family phage protein
MNYTTITPPATEPVDLTELKQYLRITHDSEDGVLTTLLRTAREWMEQETHHILMRQRILVHVSFSLRNPKVRLMDGRTAVLMTVGPVHAVHHVHSIMVDGQKLLLRRDQYQWTPNGKSDLLITKVADGVGMDIDCTAGYGPNQEDVPSFLRYQVLQCALHFYEHRDLKDVHLVSKMRECLGAYRQRRLA